MDAQLVIEVPFLLRDATGEWHEMDPGSVAALAPALAVFQMTIIEVAVGETGGLTLGFDSGAEIVVTPNPLFEAWSLAEHGIPQVTVGPGGERHWQR